MTVRKPNTLLITGARGFVGRHVLSWLAGRKKRPRVVVAVDVRKGKPMEGARSVVCDLTRAKRVGEMVRRYQPECVLHLAGVMPGAPLEASFSVNVGGCRNILEACRGLADPPRVVLVGSAAQYGGGSSSGGRLTEEADLAGRSAYAVTKSMQEQLGLLYARETGLSVTCTRVFNTIGPGQPESLVPSAFIGQIARVAAGTKAGVTVGSLEGERDFTDVRDIARALVDLLLASRDLNGEVFNICTGTGVKIGDLLSACVALSGEGIEVRQHGGRSRPGEASSVVGDPTRVRDAIGWSPRIKLEESLRDMWSEAVERR